MATDEKVQKFRDALSEYLGIPLENIRGYVMGIDHLNADGDPIFTAFWAADTTWNLRGYIEELKVNHNNFIARSSFEEMFAEEKPPDGE